LGKGECVRLLVVSDVQLDRVYEWAPPSVGDWRRSAARQALVDLVAFGRERGVDALLCAGDLLDRATVHPDTVNWLLTVLDAVGAPVLIAPGDLDWFGPYGPYTQYSWPNNVTIFQNDHLSPVELDEGVTVWGGAHRSGQCTARFLSEFSVDRGGVNIALFHASEQSGVQREQDAGTCSPFEDADIKSVGLSHAFVGHFHAQFLGKHHTYPGALIPHEFGRTSYGGAVLATLGRDGVSEREEVKIVSPPLHDLTVDVTGSRSRDDLLAAIKEAIDGLHGAARVRLCGTLDGKVRARPEDLVVGNEQLEYVVVDGTDLAYSLCFDDFLEEETVRSEFIRDVLASTMSDAQKHRVIAIGLGALEGQEL
jgi:exonuclease SbcD